MLRRARFRSIAAADATVPDDPTPLDATRDAVALFVEEHGRTPKTPVETERLINMTIDQLVRHGIWSEEAEKRLRALVR
jgi:hypothetical protein